MVLTQWSFWPLSTVTSRVAPLPTPYAVNAIYSLHYSLHLPWILPMAVTENGELKGEQALSSRLDPLVERVGTILPILSVPGSICQ